MQIHSVGGKHFIIEIYVFHPLSSTSSYEFHELLHQGIWSMLFDIHVYALKLHKINVPIFSTYFLNYPTILSDW